MKIKFMLTVILIFILSGMNISSAELAYTGYDEALFEVGGEKFLLLDAMGDDFLAVFYKEAGNTSYSETEGFLNDDVKEYLQSIFGPYVKSPFLMDEDMIEKYRYIIGYRDGVADSGIWDVYTSRIHNFDVLDYKKIIPVKNGNEVLLSNLSILNGICSVMPSEEKLIAGFTAPEKGTYDFIFKGECRVKLTLCKNGNIYEGENVGTLDSNGVSLQKSAILDEGDRVFLHIYPSDSQVQIEYEVQSDKEVYKFSSVGNIDGLWWINGGKAVSIFGDIVNASGNGYIRPAFYINREFFKNRRLDLDKTGKAVKALIKNNFEKTEIDIYDNYEIEDIFTSGNESFKITELPFTNEAGDFVEEIEEGVLNAGVKIENKTCFARNIIFYVAVYLDDALLNIDKTSDIIPPESERIIRVKTNVEYDRCSVKTFLWDEEMAPVSELSPRAFYHSDLYSLTSFADWDFFKKQTKDTDVSKYTHLVYEDGFVNLGSLPSLVWNNDEQCIYLRPEADEKCNGQGSIVIAYTVPYEGNWEICLEYKNIGTDVLGGDSGSLVLSFLEKGSEKDERIFKKIDVGVSTEKPTYNVYKTIVKANGGDRIMLSSDAHLDGYADKWAIKYSIEETEEKGDIIYEGYEADVRPKPEQNKHNAAQIKDNMVWVGLNASADLNSMQETILYLKNYIPNLGIVCFGAYPEEYSNSDFFEENDIPFLVQNFGTAYAEYISEEDAWEYDWYNKPLDGFNTYTLSGTGHAYALPHSAVRECFLRLIKSTANAGYSAFGYADCVWDWGAYGKACFNPQTIKEFECDLLQQDEGINVNGETIYFWDYFEYYTGGKSLDPGDAGFDSWEEYMPITYVQYQQYIKQGRNMELDLALTDMLCHYELLKFMQFLGYTAENNGISAQIMVNAEFFPNGVDLLFLNRLDGIKMTDEEFFGDTDFLDGAYYRRNYLIRDAEKNGIKPGGVMEAGSGGNAGAYYETEIAYAAAFELGAMGTVEHLEADFLYPNKLDFIDENETMRTRNEQIISYGMGFNAGKALAVQKRNADFICISSRPHLKQWSVDSIYKPWSSRLHFDDNLDFILSKIGYNFEGISQEGAEDIDSEKFVIYSPAVATQYIFENLLQKTECGNIENLVISADRPKTSVADNMLLKDFKELNLQFGYRVGEQMVNEKGLLKAEGKYSVTADLK